MILERLQKSSFVGIYDAVANFNIGAKDAVLIHEDLKIEPNYYTSHGCVKANMKQIRNSIVHSQENTLRLRYVRGLKKSKMTKRRKLKERHTKQDNFKYLFSIYQLHYFVYI